MNHSCRATREFASRCQQSTLAVITALRVSLTLAAFVMAAMASNSHSADDSAANKTASSAIASFGKWLAADEAARPKLGDGDFARAALSRDDAKAALDLLWQDRGKNIKSTRAEEMKTRRLKIDSKEMPFWYKVYGERPAAGRSLFISLHGGGGAPKQVNDSQYENQKRLYTPKEGVYVAPRAPTDTWDLWHQSHIDKFFARLIENMVVFEDVDPNRVYVMGYSAGGDGVYQIAPRMADRWAAASMMAGHPNDASPRSLRNVPFTIHVGGKDAAFNRNKVAVDWKDKLDALRKEDPSGYEHEVQVHENKGHWMDREDAVAVEWMAKHTRDPLPKRIVWRQDDVAHERSYWLAVDKQLAQGGKTIIASRDGQQIALESPDVAKVTVRLTDAMLNLDEPIVITANGKEVFRGKANRTIETLAKTLDEYGDAKMTFAAEVTVDVPAK